jgi:dTDP-4-dehydrorhamnose reductase
MESLSGVSAANAWITGAGGLIGSWIVRQALERSVLALTRQDLDLTDFAAVRQRFRQEKPKLVIHCAAVSQSPACQANPTLAYKVNVDATAVLADLAADIPFVFFSSDLVFDGRQGNYQETDAVNPLSVYGETKVAAEQIVRGHPKHTIIRTSLNGGVSPTGDRGFNEQLRHGWQAGKSVTLFTDEFRCPIAAEVTARAVWELVAKEAAGVYHVAGSERLSRYQIGQLVAARWPDLRPKLKSASLKEYQGAPRPADSSLNCDKIQELLSFRLPRLTDWLAARPDQEF